MKNIEFQSKNKTNNLPMHEQQTPRRVASRMEGVVKNVGTKNIKKAAKGK